MTPLFAADVVPAVESWVLPVVQGLISLLLTVVGLYLASTVKGLREDTKELRKHYEVLAKSHADVDKVVAGMQAVCAERHGVKSMAHAGG